MSGNGHPSDSAGLSGSTGAVFIDVFKKSERPLHVGSVALIYIAGPRGDGCRRVKNYRPAHQMQLDDKVTFLSNVSDTAQRALDMVHDYNEQGKYTKSGLPEIKNIRWCLVSGGAYMHEGVTKTCVAEATIKGMMRSYAQSINLTLL